VEVLSGGSESSGAVAVKVLGCLAANNAANRAAIVEAGVLPLLVARLRGGLEHGREQAAMALKYLAVGNHAVGMTIAEAGAIPPLVELLWGASHAGRAVAAGILGSLGADNLTIAMKDVAEVGAIRPLLALLRSGVDAAQLERHGHISGFVRVLEDASADTTAKIYAARVPGRLSAGNASNSAAIVEAGALLPLVELLRCGSEEDRRLAAEALGNLAVANDAMIRAAIVEAGAVPLLVAWLSGGSGGTGYDSCSITVGSGRRNLAARALGFLADDNDNIVAAVAETGVVPLRVTRLRGGLDQGREQMQAAGVLGNLAVANNAMRVAIVEACALPVLVALLHSGTQEDREQVAVVLEHLAVGNHAVWAAIVEAGALPPLVDLLWGASHAGRAVGARILGSLGAGNLAIAMKDVAEVGTIRLLLALLRSGADAAQLERHGHISGLVRVLEDASIVDAWGSIPFTKLNAVEVLGSLAAGSRAAIVEAGAIPLLVDLLRSGSDLTRSRLR
jgi:hypothetical protein